MWQINLRTIRFAAVSALAAFTWGCVETTAPEKDTSSAMAEYDSEAEMKLLAKIDLKDGGEAQFLGSEAGIFVVVEGSPNEDPLAGARSGINDPVALYEALANAAAPASLLEAAARAAARPRPNDVAAPAPLVEEPEDATSRRQVGIASAASFRNDNCPTLNWDYSYCLTTRTGNAEIREPGGSMNACVESVRGGAIRLSAEYWDGWAQKWRVVRDWTIDSGDTSPHFQVTGFFTTLRTRVREATGDTYHLAVYGDR